MKKKLLIAAAAVLAVFILLKCVKIESVDEYYLSHADDINESSETVTFSITCAAILSHMDALDSKLKEEDRIPSDGIILTPSKYVLRQGDTAFSLLSRICRYHKIRLDYQGQEKGPNRNLYIKGIDYIYEFSCGRLSGWMYRVNGVVPEKGAADYTPENGDTIEFIYTCDLGNDIKDTSDSAASESTAESIGTGSQSSESTAESIGTGSPSSESASGSLNSDKEESAAESTGSEGGLDGQP